MRANPYPNKRKSKCKLMEMRYLIKAGLCLICAEQPLWNIRTNISFIPQRTTIYQILADEIIDWLYDFCKNALLEQFKFCFLPYERDALRELMELIDRYFKDQSLLEGDTYDYLVYQNKSWVEVRELALKTLYIFGYDLEDFDYD